MFRIILHAKVFGFHFPIFFSILKISIISFRFVLVDPKGKWKKWEKITRRNVNDNQFSFQMAKKGRRRRHRRHHFADCLALIFKWKLFALLLSPLKHEKNFTQFIWIQDAIVLRSLRRRQLDVLSGANDGIHFVYNISLLDLKLSKLLGGNKRNVDIDASLRKYRKSRKQ